MIRVISKWLRWIMAASNGRCGGLTRTQPERGPGTGQQEVTSNSNVDLEPTGAAKDPRGAEEDGGHESVLRLGGSSRGARRDREAPGSVAAAN